MRLKPCRMAVSLQGLDDLADGAEVGEVSLDGILDGDVGLGNGSEHAVPRFDVADQADGFLPADGDGKHGPGEHDGVPQGQHRDGVGEIGLVQFQQGRITDHRHDIHFYARLGVHIKDIFHQQ